MKMASGPTNSLADIAGLAIGNATDQRIKSGVTVVLPDAPMTAAVQVMGGAPGTRETDLLAADKTVDKVHALVLAGGSAFGLDAASGVMDWLAARGRGFAVGPAIVPIVPAAILFDLQNGGEKDWDVNPYRALGAQACDAARTQAPDLGSCGAGTGAIAGGLKGGLGSASLVLPSGVTVATLVACNALGNATIGPAGHFWAAPFEMNGEFGGRGPYPQTVPPDATFATKMDDMANTTIAIVATDAQLTKAEAQRVATAAHDGFARALIPAHTPMDGDLIFAAATGAKALCHEDRAADILHIGHGAALTTARAIARSIYLARSMATDTLPCWQEKFGVGP